MLLLAAAVSATLSVTMLLFQRAHRRYPGFSLWTLGTAMISANFLLSGLRGLIPVLPSVVGVNILILLAPPVFLDGVRRFLGLGRLAPRWYALAAATLAPCIFFILVRDRIVVRTVILMATGAAFFAAVVILLARHERARRSVLHSALGLQFALIALSMLGRAVWALGRSDFSLLLESPMQYLFFGATTVLHLGITVTFVLLTTSRTTTALEATQALLAARVEQLERAHGEVRSLSGLLPICSGCKRIRDDAGEWIQMETYVRDRSDAEFSHGFCPDCLARYFPRASRPTEPSSPG